MNKIPNWLLWTTYLLFCLIYLIAKDGMFSRDGVVYMELGMHFADGDFYTVFRHPQHPLTGCLIGSFITIGFAPYWAGICVSMISVAILLWVVKLSVALIFNEEAASWSFLLLCVNPYLIYYATDILSDPNYWAALFTAFYFLVRFHKERKWPSAFFSGLFLAVAYFSRPEALIMAFVTFVIWFVVELRREEKSLQRFKGMAQGLLAFIFTCSLLVCALHQVCGEWRLSLKVNFVNTLGLGKFITAKEGGRELFHLDGVRLNNNDQQKYQKSDASGKFLMFYENVIAKFLSALFAYLVFVPLLIVVYLPGRWRDFTQILKKGKAYLMILAAVFLVTQLQWHDDHYLSNRHYMPAMIAIAGLGGPLWLLFRGLLHQKVWKCLILLIVLTGALHKSKIQRSHISREKNFKYSLRELGHQLKARPEDVIIGPDIRIAWFAQKKFAEIEMNDDTMLYLDAVETKLYEMKEVSGPFIVVLSIKSPHNKHSYEKIENGLFSRGWKLYASSKRAQAYIKDDWP